jgi:hypothetical protein
MNLNISKKILIKNIDLFNNKFCENCKHFIKIDTKNLNNLFDVNQCSKFKIILNDKSIVNYSAYSARDNINLCGPKGKHFED